MARTGVFLGSLPAAVLLGAAPTGASTAAAAGFVFVQTPSKNIGCAYQPAISRATYRRCAARSGPA